MKTQLKIRHIIKKNFTDQYLLPIWVISLVTLFVPSSTWNYLPFAITNDLLLSCGFLVFLLLLISQLICQQGKFPFTKQLAHIQIISMLWLIPIMMLQTMLIYAGYSLLRCLVMALLFPVILLVLIKIPLLSINKKSLSNIRELQVPFHHMSKNEHPHNYFQKTIFIITVVIWLIFLFYIKINGIGPYYYTNQAEDFYQDGNLPQAITYLNVAIKNNSQSVRALQMRGEVYYDLLLYLLAIKDFEAIIIRHPKNLPALGYCADSYRQIGEYEKAIKYYDLYLEQNKANYLVFAYRGECQRLLGNYDHALHDFTEAILQNPNHAWTYGSRGQVYREIGIVDLAINDFIIALDLDANLNWVQAELELLLTPEN